MQTEIEQTEQIQAEETAVEQETVTEEIQTEELQTEELQSEQTPTEQQTDKKFYQLPTFWTAVIGGLTCLCVLIFIIVALGKPRQKPEPTEPSATQTTPTETTEATLPPPEANPIGLGDFAMVDGYLTCLSTQSVLGIDVSEWQDEIDWQQVKDAGFSFVMIRVGGR